MPTKKSKEAPAPAPAEQPKPVPAHAILSPSSSDRWIACPGSIAAAMAATVGKPNKTNFYAAEGTAAHEVLEMSMRLHQEPEAFIGTKIKVDEFEITVTEEMAHAVGHAKDYIADQMARNPNLRLHIEVRVKPGPLIGLHNGECEGTADIILEDGRECIVIDYKHGAGIYVEVKDNSQLKLYCGGARERNGKPFFRYKKVIVQPRMYSNNGRPVREASITESELVTWLQKTVRPSAHAALAPEAPRRAGDHCRWCPANGQCKTFARHAASQAAKEFGPVDPTEDEIVKVDNAHEMTPEQLSMALKNTHILELWVNSVRAEAFDRLKAGGKIPGFKLGYGARRRIWREKSEKLLHKALVKLGLREDEIYTPATMLSPAKMEELLKNKNLWPKKPRNGERPPTVMDKFIDYTNPDVRVMPAEDAEASRHEKSKHAAKEFTK